MAWTIVGIYAIVVVLLHIPAVQRAVASQTAQALMQVLGTKVSVGNVNLGFLNRVIVDDVLIEDQQQRKMLQCNRLSARIDILPLINGKISISSAQVFGMKALLVKPSANAPLNCQFVLDSLASKDTTTHKPLDLHISSLVIRNTSMAYERLDMPRKSGGLDLNHLALDRVSCHVMLNTLTDDSVAVKMKKLSFVERNTDFEVTSLSFEAEANKSKADLRGFNLITDYSDVDIDASVTMADGKLKDYNLISKHSSVGMHDVACFVPQLRNLSGTYFLDVNIHGDDRRLNISNLILKSSKKDLELNMLAHVSSAQPLPDAMKRPETLVWGADIRQLYIGEQLASEVLNAFGNSLDIIDRIGSITYQAQLSGSNGNIKAKGQLASSAVTLRHDATISNHHLNLQLETGTMRLGYLLNSSAIGDTELNAVVDADLTGNKQMPVRNADIRITAPLLTANGYAYRNAAVNLTQRGEELSLKMDISDLNVDASINAIANNASALYRGNVMALRNVSVDAGIRRINPNVLGLTDKWQQTVFGVDVKANVANLQNPLQSIVADVNNFNMTSPANQYSCDRISLTASETNTTGKDIVITSDFADLHASGHFDFATLPQSLTNLIAQRLPTLPGVSQYKTQNNEIELSATVKDTEVMRQLLGIDISAAENIDMHAFINDRMHIADIQLSAPRLTCFGMDFNATRLQATCPGDTLSINLNTQKQNYNGSLLTMALKGKAANNNLNTDFSWQNGHGNDFKGSVRMQSQFLMANGQPMAVVNIMPSEVMISDTLWNLHRSSVSYTANNLSVNNFLVENGRQHISIDGRATKSVSDSIVVNLQDVNVAYIMNLVNFHSVDFSGFASGSAVGKALFSAPQAYTDLDVRNFLFENGRLGTLTAHGRWDNELGQINIDAQCVDHDVIPEKGAIADFSSKADDALSGNRDGYIKIDGYVSIKHNSLDLDIKADNTRLEFIESYTGSFMNNINAWATGRVRVYGPFSAVNLTGEAVANGSMHIIPLNTTYTLHNGYVKLVPDDIQFLNDTIYDKNGNRGIVNGGLHHRHLGKMTYDLDISARHMLCYDFPNLNGSTFCGHVIGTGTCKIVGRPGEVNFDIDAYPDANTVVTYNASSPDALQNQEFITWKDSSLQLQNADRATTAEQKPADDFHTNVRLNFLIHATPASTLRVLMDQSTGDYIALNGNGTLRATYYNKGGMQIFGNYLVERGDYKMTIQQVITKNFEFLPGGSIAFGGNPYDAAIDLQAQYVVPSAPLSDLNIGNSFKSSTVRVNCLMNITGTPEQPVVEFDLNLPQASADIQQMITSLMDSEEARNQQVVYLLAIGRFYSANNSDAELQSQASLAMQSFLSGTVSQQLNNLISNVIIKDRNWNFGANISPGDEGMMNAEYEGLVSGRMLNNRLLLNGQFGYRDNVNATTSFIGDFDVRYLLLPNGNLQVKVYNQTSDRYFTKSNLNTQGLGIILKHDFNNFIPNFRRKRNNIPNSNDK